MKRGECASAKTALASSASQLLLAGVCSESYVRRQVCVLMLMCKWRRCRDKSPGAAVLLASISRDSTALKHAKTFFDTYLSLSIDHTKAGARGRTHLQMSLC